jgi:hypothetical protein
MPCLRFRTGGWREDPAEEERTGGWREDPAVEEKRPADLYRLINLRFASPLATG